MLEEFSQTTTLSDKSKRTLVRVLADFLTNRVKGLVSATTRKQTRAAILNRFPGLYGTTPESMSALMTEQNVTTGQLGHAFRNAFDRFKARNASRNLSILNVSTHNMDSSSSDSLLPASTESTPSSSQATDNRMSQSSQQSIVVHSPSQLCIAQLDEDSLSAQTPPESDNNESSATFRSIISQSVPSSNPSQPHSDTFARSTTPRLTEIKKHLHFLQFAVGIPDQVKQIEAALKATFEYRMEQLKSGSKEVYYNIFYMNYTWITFDFDLICPGKKECLTSQVEEFEKIISKLWLKRTTKSHSLQIDSWPHEIQVYLKLISMMGRVKGGFSGSVDHFIQRVPANCSSMELMSKVSSFPFILLKEGDTNDYVVSVDGKLIPVNDCSSFHKVFDLIFKLIHVWNIEYTDSLKLFYTFFEIVIFKMETVSHSTKLRDLIQAYTNEAQN